MFVMNIKKSCIYLGIIVLLSVFLKILIFGITVVGDEELISGDMPGYLLLADSIYQKQSFGSFEDGQFHPNIRRTPGYPVFIAVHKLFFGNSLIPLFITQILMSSLLAVFVYSITRKMTGSTMIAFLGAIMIALEPTYIHFCLLPLTDMFFTFVLVVSVASFIKWKESSATWWLCLSAFLLSVSVLTRPIAIFLFIVFIPFICFYNANWKSSAVNCLIWIIISVAPVAGWIVRNAVVVGVPQLSSISSVNMLFYRGAGVKSKLEGIPWSQAKKNLQDEAIEYKEIHNPTQKEYLDYLSSQGIKLILNHPVLYARVHAEGVAQMLFGPALRYVFWRLGFPQEGFGILTALNNGDLSEGIKALKNKGLFSVFLGGIELAYCLALFFLVGFGLFYYPRFGWCFLLVCIISAYFIVLSGGPEAGARFRMPLLPFWIPLALSGLMIICEKLGCVLNDKDRYK